MSARCSSACGWCGMCTATWERENGDDYCDACGQHLDETGACQTDGCELAAGYGVCGLCGIRPGASGCACDEGDDL